MPKPLAEPEGASSEDEDSPRAPTMERSSPALAEKAEREAAERRAVETAAALEAPIGDARLRALKEKARREIDARLKAARKRRRLLRGGEAP